MFFCSRDLLGHCGSVAMAVNVYSMDEKSLMREMLVEEFHCAES